MGKRIILIQRKDGKFFRSNQDHADEWVTNPFNATDRGWCAHQRDARYYDNKEFVDCDLVEFDITATPSGRTLEQMFPEDYVVNK